MSWLLFLDESGHDHKNTPYEVRGGIAVHATKLWPLIQAVRTLEQSLFGSSLHDHGTEIKGHKLLDKDRFAWAAQSPPFDDAARRKHALNFLNCKGQARTPRRDEFTAYGQACLAFVERTAETLRSHGCRLFASMIPCMKPPRDARTDVPRKDVVFLLERYFYFLEEAQESGLIVMDGTDKNTDRDFVRRMTQYFTGTLTGKQRTKWVVPVPLFVESDMAYGVQLADLCIYCLNWGYRTSKMTGRVRTDVRDFAWLLEPLIWKGSGYRQNATGIETYPTSSVVYVPDPYLSRGGQK